MDVGGLCRLRGLCVCVRRVLGGLVSAALILLAASPTPAPALDSHPPAAITADDIELDLETGRRFYRGNVVFRHGGTRLTCDTLITRHDQDADRAPTAGVCIGNPGEFHHQPAGLDRDRDTNSPATARAFRITLDRKREQLILEGRAEVELAGDSIRGERITYDLAKEKVTITAAPTNQVGGKTSRPRVTLQPRTQAP